MALKKITGKDIKEAVDWLWEHKQGGGCVHQVLETTNDGTKLCFVVGWSKGADYGDDEKEYGYFDDGYCISAKIGYQHRNNAMQTDYDWDFNMPYDLETGDVWDTSSYVPRDADWVREAADYNKEAEKIWAAYGDPDGKNWWDDDADDKAPLDLMESKKKPEAKKHTCSMQKKKESVSKKNEAYSDFPLSDEDVKLVVNYVDVDEHGGSFSVDTPKDGQTYSLEDMKDMIKGMCDDCTGYADISRDGSDILIIVNAPEMDENGEWTDEYYDAMQVRCSVRVMSTSLESFVDYLDKYDEE